jgi:FtsP/CotA-like multicopper oxidase with cupredoxin domain
MNFNRRQFLGVLAALSALPSLACAETLTPDGFLEIRAASANLGLLEDGAGRTAAWLLGKGPEPLIIRGKQGQELKLRFINDLDHEIWLHFFGVRGPSDLMTINVRPGESEAVDCVFTPPDAGTFWIAPIADQSRARDMGLQAVLLVEEAEAVTELSDLVMVLDDWKLGETGEVMAGFGDVEVMVGEGRLGNWFTVNNRFRPRLPMAAGKITRLRLVNAANVRMMSLLFKGHDPLLIARDGQPVPPGLLEGKALVLAPGQRADLLLSPADGDIGIALDLFEDVVEIAYLIPEDAKAVLPGIAENFALPPNPVPALGSAEDTRTFTLVIEGGIKGALKSAKFNGEERDLRALLENGKGWAINGVAGPSPEPLFTVVKGETVELDIDNRTAFAQPLHIHGHAWQEIDEQPSGRWQDTIVIPPREAVTLAFRADNPGLWALHSLVAERADGGLIGSFSVTDPDAVSPSGLDGVND